MESYSYSKGIITTSKLVNLFTFDDNGYKYTTCVVNFFLIFLTFIINTLYYYSYILLKVLHKGFHIKPEVHNFFVWAMFMCNWARDSCSHICKKVNF
jgi:hypothetical protein